MQSSGRIEEMSVEIEVVVCLNAVKKVEKPPTRFSHFGDGNVLLVGHKAQDGEDGEAGNKTGSTV